MVELGGYWINPQQIQYLKEVIDVHASTPLNKVKYVKIVFSCGGGGDGVVTVHESLGYVLAALGIKYNGEEETTTDL